MPQPLPVITGRAAQANPLNRFETLQFDREMDHWEQDAEAMEALGKVQTQYLVDFSRGILTRNDSPDVGFSVSINPYRGCEHGCIYCYARPTHEWLGFSCGLDFETRIMVKSDAPKLLRAALADPKYEPDCIAISGVTDCYQPVERHLKITRGCLEVLLAVGNPAGIVTKSALVTRDIDILAQMARRQLIAVYMSVTTLDPDLSRKMEPRAAAPARRLEAIARMSAAGVPVGVLAAPVVLEDVTHPLNVEHVSSLVFSLQICPLHRHTFDSEYEDDTARKPSEPDTITGADDFARLVLPGAVAHSAFLRTRPTC